MCSLAVYLNSFKNTDVWKKDRPLSLELINLTHELKATLCFSYFMRSFHLVLLSQDAMQATTRTQLVMASVSYAPLTVNPVQAVICAPVKMVFIGLPKTQLTTAVQVIIGNVKAGMTSIILN